MRIAFIYDAVYPWIKGGAEKRIYEIGRRLADRGHEVHWFGVKWWECGKNLKNDGLRLLLSASGTTVMSVGGIQGSFIDFGRWRL